MDTCPRVRESEVVNLRRNFLLKDRVELIRVLSRLYNIMEKRNFIG